MFGDINNGQFIPNKFDNIIADCWFQIRNKYQNIELDEFIIMPNHIHGIIQIVVGAIHELPLQPFQSNNPLSRRKMLLPKIIGYFKMNSAKQINKLRGLTGMHVWQRNYYDHIIRNEDELNRIRYYIKNNPVNWKDDDLYI